MRITRLVHGATMAVLGLSALALIPAAVNAEPRWARGGGARPPGLERAWGGQQHSAGRGAPAFRSSGWQGAGAARGGWSRGGSAPRTSGGGSGWSYGGGGGPPSGGGSGGWTRGGGGSGYHAPSGDGGWSYGGGGTHYRGGYGGYGGHYGGGYHGYYYPRYRYYGYPRSYVSFGLRFGYPYYPYCYDDYPVVVHRPARVVVVLAEQPPADCDYYDPYCNEAFSCLADYEDHLQDVDHDPILEVVDHDSGSCLRTYSFSTGHWRLLD